MTDRPAFRIRQSVLAWTLLGALLTGGLFFYTTTASAQSADAIQTQIKDRAQKIADLQREIQQYQNELNKTAQERQTLERDVRTLDTSRKKISTSINLTQEKIQAAEASIREIGLSIEDKERRMKLNKEAVAASIRAQYYADRDSYLESILSSGKQLKDFWEAADQVSAVQVALRDDVGRLEEIKGELLGSKQQAENTHKELASLKQNLAGEKLALDVTRSEKSQILSVTKNQESEYQKLLKAKQAAHEQFEKELLDLETKLKFSLDLASIPKSGSGILSWPFDGPYMVGCQAFSKPLGNITCITQYFGNTPFAQLGAYKGKGHNGIDFRAPLGTAIMSAASGVVTATGDSDQVRGCYSYGKWVLIDHGNGLSTLYAHLSRIEASKGQSVARGDRIGLSGATGYSTGPHLHFTVYATPGVQVRQLGGSTPCSRATIPIAGTEAYLNPLAYL